MAIRPLQHYVSTAAVKTVMKVRVEVVGLRTLISVDLPPPTQIRPKSLPTLIRSVNEGHAGKVELIWNSDYPPPTRGDTPLQVQDPQEGLPLRYNHPQMVAKQLYNDVGSVSHITDAHP